MGEHYVYVIFRPDGTPCYVGKGKGRRAQQHAKHSHNRHLRSIFAQSGGSLPIVKIRENIPDAEAREVEIALIAAIGREDLGRGPLVNFGDGGEGPSGVIRSAEFCKKMSLAKKGKKLSPEHIAKRSAALRGRKRSPETIAKISAAHTGKKLSPAHIEKMRVRVSGSSWTPEMRAKMSDPENVADRAAKISAGNTGKVRTDEFKSKISTANLGKTLSPETRAKLSASRLKLFEERRASLLLVAAVGQ